MNWAEVQFDPGLNAELKQFVRSNNAVEEIDALVESPQVSLPVMGSEAQEPKLSISCPVLADKSAH